MIFTNLNNNEQNRTLNEKIKRCIEYVKNNDILAKDTGIALSLAQQAKLPTPLLSPTQNRIQTANLTSDAESDFSSAVKLYESWTNIKIE